MKKFTKICLILAGCFFLLGTVFCITGIAMGGRITDTDLWYDVDEKEFRTGQDAEVSASYEQTFTDITELSVSIATAEMDIVEGEGQEFVVKAVKTGSGFKCKQDGKTLKIEEDGKRWKVFGFDFSGISSKSNIVLEVPKGTVLKKADFEIGVGSLNVEGLHVKELKGECGVGEFFFEGRIDGDCALECGVGNMELTLYGSEEDFNYELESGIGEIVIGTIGFSKLGNEQKFRNGADKTMKLECGIGDITISFEEE